MKKIPLRISVLMCTILWFSNCSSEYTTTSEEDVDDTSATNEVVNDDYTVGLRLNTEDAYDGYTLFAPILSTTTYLLDNCGEEVYSWPSNYEPSHSVYLLENGYLLRTGNDNNSSFNAGGRGGIIEMINADGEVVWDYTISTTTECQHHDVEYMQNGNILVIAWDKKTSSEVENLGRTDDISELWSEKIIEIKPDITSGTAEIVWEWYATDHTIQDENDALSNFGVVADHPELLDINFNYDSDEEEDWLHFNGIDYNEELDQILVSSRSYSEFYIIDHSTTTEEAASHSGGTFNKGGDILYRWGNPQTYDMGDEGDQKLFVQHNANWIEDSYTDGGMVIVFNNQAGNSYSTVDVIDTEVNADGSYTLTNGVYGASDFQWTYSADSPTDMYSAYISGATRLPNGNTLICVGATGYFTEVNYEGETVWEYVNPVGSSGATTQYTSINDGSNRVFRAEKYAKDFKGLEDYTLTSKGTIESGSDYDCSL
ncbi:aryl-sulfate sulfotransferase [Polaribacter sargassicola]|uniref:aryl-sulfate sulfotransferase n=1 Tax=Polaribacter sargassicola TaxID=2836891 RepID=UPI001F01A831|nr:aryl-sulfate sulfotransferase [Polaribacter sp. DS7-9]MCG1035471.1 arylsulfotransferase family protein [Polaribacter sp. DS7-9]